MMRRRPKWVGSGLEGPDPGLDGVVLHPSVARCHVGLLVVVNGGGKALVALEQSGILVGRGEEYGLLLLL